MEDDTHEQELPVLLYMGGMVVAGQGLLQGLKSVVQPLLLTVPGVVVVVHLVQALLHLRDYLTSGPTETDQLAESLGIELPAVDAFVPLCGQSSRISLQRHRFAEGDRVLLDVVLVEHQLDREVAALFG